MEEDTRQLALVPVLADDGKAHRVRFFLRKGQHTQRVVQVQADTIYGHQISPGPHKIACRTVSPRPDCTCEAFQFTALDHRGDWQTVCDTHGRLVHLVCPHIVKRARHLVSAGTFKRLDARSRERLIGLLRQIAAAQTILCPTDSFALSVGRIVNSNGKRSSHPGG